MQKYVFFYKYQIPEQGFFIFFPTDVHRLKQITQKRICVNPQYLRHLLAIQHSTLEIRTGVRKRTLFLFRTV